MPSAKTEATELSVGFGLLGIDPRISNYNEVDLLFQGTLSRDKFERLKKEFSTAFDLYTRLYEIGLSLRNSHSLLKDANSIQWLGPQQQASTASIAKDLLANQTPISVKVESNVVLNPSPYNLFVSIPKGSAVAQNAENWYLDIAYSEFQELYSQIRSYHLGNFPEDVRDFEVHATRLHRKALQRTIDDLPSTAKEDFYNLYVALCHTVAQKSAIIFNQNFSHTLGGPTRSSILEVIARNFFRLDAIRYVLCGIDNGFDFAVDIPDLTSWKKNWSFTSVIASPDLTRKQSVVNFRVLFERRGTKERYQANFHAEIRWSHGKFCGNPEAKFYKEFFWKDIAFLNIII